MRAILPSSLRCTSPIRNSTARPLEWKLASRADKRASVGSSTEVPTEHPLVGGDYVYEFLASGSAVKKV
jgi:hypothetical protein